MQSFMQNWKIWILEPKTPYMGVLDRFLKKAIVIFEINTLKSVKVKQIHVKLKKISFGPKYLLLGYIWLEFKKTIVIFETNTLKFFKMQSKSS